MAMTFADAYREVRLHAPAAPLALARAWVNAAYEDLCRGRSWGFLRAETTLRILASRAVDVGVTQDSTTVTSGGLFIATDAGRNLRIGIGPTYTIQEVTTDSVLVLDRAYTEDTDPDATATILDAFVTMPADFSSFRTIPDRYNQRRLGFWFTEDELLILDPDRRTSDTGPRALVAASPSPYMPTLGRVRYEYWPRPTAARTYPALYNRQAADLTETTLFSGVLADAKEALVAGALARAAAWPGTLDVKNPFFSADLIRLYKAEFETQKQRLALKDDTQYPEDLHQVHWEYWGLGDLAYNDRSLRATDVTAGALY